MVLLEREEQLVLLEGALLIRASPCSSRHARDKA
jgi:hypothetical protein